MNNLVKNLVIWLGIGLVLMTVFNQFNTRSTSQTPMPSTTSETPPTSQTPAPATTSAGSGALGAVSGPAEPSGTSASRPPLEQQQG